MMTDISKIIRIVRDLEADHGPGGWPAVEMATLSALADALEAEKAEVFRLQCSHSALYDEVETLRNLLHRALPIIDADASMMADITRHAPLPPDAQAIHDGTEYESERLAREIRAAMKDRP